MMYFTLNNGLKMPMLNLGTYQVPGDQMKQVLSWAKEIGYVGLDTAGAYNNEIFIGDALQELGRDSFFITSKVDVRQFIDMKINGRKKTVRDCFDESKSFLRTDYIDLFLVHWPVPEYFLQMWDEIVKLYEEKQVGAIGVSNCQVEHLQQLIDHKGVIPALNQCEIHPFNNRRDLVNFCTAHSIRMEAHSPFAWGNPNLIKDSKLNLIAEKYGKSITQVIARWDLQNGVALCPKSVHFERLKENFNVFDFALSEEDMAYIDSLNSNSSVYDKKKKEIYKQLYK